jgi:hypothetical protein
MAVSVGLDDGHHLACAGQLPNPLEIAAQFGEGNFNPYRAQKFIRWKIHRIYFVQRVLPFKLKPGSDFKFEI